MKRKARTKQVTEKVRKQVPQNRDCNFKGIPDKSSSSSDSKKASNVKSSPSSKIVLEERNKLKQLISSGRRASMKQQSCLFIIKDQIESAITNPSMESSSTTSTVSKTTTSTRTRSKDLQSCIRHFTSLESNHSTVTSKGATTISATESRITISRGNLQKLMSTNLDKQKASKWFEHSAIFPGSRKKQKRNWSQAFRGTEFTTIETPTVDPTLLHHESNSAYKKTKVVNNSTDKADYLHQIITKPGSACGVTEMQAQSAELQIPPDEMINLTNLTSKSGTNIRHGEPIHHEHTQAQDDFESLPGPKHLKSTKSVQDLDLGTAVTFLHRKKRTHSLTKQFTPEYKVYQSRLVDIALKEYSQKSENERVEAFFRNRRIGKI